MDNPNTTENKLVSDETLAFMHWNAKSDNQPVIYLMTYFKAWFQNTKQQQFLMAYRFLELMDKMMKSANPQWDLSNFKYPRQQIVGKGTSFTSFDLAKEMDEIAKQFKFHEFITVHDLYFDDQPALTEPLSNPHVAGNYQSSQPAPLFQAPSDVASVFQMPTSSNSIDEQIEEKREFGDSDEVEKDQVKHENLKEYMEAVQQIIQQTVLHPTLQLDLNPLSQFHSQSISQSILQPGDANHQGTTSETTGNQDHQSPQPVQTCRSPLDVSSVLLTPKSSKSMKDGEEKEKEGSGSFEKEKAHDEEDKKRIKDRVHVNHEEQEYMDVYDEKQDEKHMKDGKPTILIEKFKLDLCKKDEKESKKKGMQTIKRVAESRCGKEERNNREEGMYRVQRKYQEQRKYREQRKYQDGRRYREGRKYQEGRRYREERKYRQGRQNRETREYLEDRQNRERRKFREERQMREQCKYREERNYQEERKYQEERQNRESRKDREDCKYEHKNKKREQETSALFLQPIPQPSPPVNDSSEDNTMRIVKEMGSNFWLEHLMNSK